MDTSGFDASLRVHDILKEAWVGIVLLVSIVVLAWTNVSARKKWNLLREGVFRLRLGQQTMRDDISLRDRGLIALLATAIVLIALFVYQLSVETGSADRLANMHSFASAALNLLLQNLTR